MCDSGSQWTPQEEHSRLMGPKGASTLDATKKHEASSAEQWNSSHQSKTHPTDDIND